MREGSCRSSFLVRPLVSEEDALEKEARTERLLLERKARR